MKFKQAYWLKKYIEFNTDKRKKAANSFGRIFLKLANNSIFGKPNFILQKIFSKNFVAVHKIKPVLTLNKPIYVGFSVLDLSKLLMYKFHYEFTTNCCLLIQTV